MQSKYIEQIQSGYIIEQMHNADIYQQISSSSIESDIDIYNIRVKGIKPRAGSKTCRISRISSLIKLHRSDKGVNGNLEDIKSLVLVPFFRIDNNIVN